MEDPKLVQIWDCETNGTQDDPGAGIVELGRVRLNLETLEIGDAFEALVKPVVPIGYVTMAVHHIRNEDVETAPPVEQVWPTFWAGLGRDDLVAAHNAKFEQHFHDGEGRRWICTYKCAMAVWPDAPGHSNQVLRYFLGLDYMADFDRLTASAVHRALPDAYVTAFVLRELLRLRPWSDLVDISARPVLLPTLTFGKHKGMAYRDAPLDYLYWIRDKSDMGEDVKHTADHWIKGGNQ